MEKHALDQNSQFSCDSNLKDIEKIFFRKPILTIMKLTQDLEK